jgi:hypothetical protein
LISDGSAELLISGFIISTNQLNDPLTSDTVYANIGTLVDGSTDDNIISLWTEVSELLPSTIYYVKAFVQNQVGTAFSPVASFTTGVIVSGCFENQACNYNSSANQNDGSCLFVNNPCNDSNPSTIDDLVTEDCVCLGVPVVLGCMNPSACNYNNLADLEDGSCLIVGINCDDGNSLTSLDYVNANCQCEGLELQPQLIPEDGVNCLMDTIQFTQFSTSSVIQSIDQIQDVMVNLEHSYMGDLSIKLICPNQSSVFLHQQGGAGVGLGEPIDVDADTNPGIGYNYFWNPNATNGTWIENAIPPILPSGTYSSVENFSNLLGCPLNGLWVIQICDLWQGDNGYLFDWNIHLLGN